MREHNLQRSRFVAHGPASPRENVWRFSTAPTLRSKPTSARLLRWPSGLRSRFGIASATFSGSLGTIMAIIVSVERDRDLLRQLRGAGATGVALVVGAAA